ncbi:MAG: hypothetical protein R2695_12415 [Acidimicrobiales bacterium]
MSVTKRSVLVPLLVVVALFAAACQSHVSAHTLRVVQAQEDGFFENGDEPYVAVIQWRVIPGTPGSASAHFVGNLAELASGADDGAVLSIPAAMGTVHFDDVQASNLDACSCTGSCPRSSER